MVRRDREDAVAAGTVRVVAERRGDGGGLTRVVESVAGPVMAAAGVDASNTGPSAELLAAARRTRTPRRRRCGRASSARLGLPSGTALAVVLSDTAGRPWRDGLTDFALGSAGLHVLEDLRGATDHDGRPLAVTMRALADEVAAAADLVKGKADGIPAALVRGLDRAWFVPDARRRPVAGADRPRRLVRARPRRGGAGGARRRQPGAAAAGGGRRAVGACPTSRCGVRVGRVVALTLLDVAGGGSADVGVDEAAGTAEVTLGAAGRLRRWGRLVTRLEVAAASEGLHADARSGERAGGRRRSGVAPGLRTAAVASSVARARWGSGCSLRRTSSAIDPTGRRRTSPSAGGPATGTVPRKMHGAVAAPRRGSRAPRTSSAAPVPERVGRHGRIMTPKQGRTVDTSIGRTADARSCDAGGSSSAAAHGQVGAAAPSAARAAAGGGSGQLEEALHAVAVPGIRLEELGEAVVVDRRCR